MKRALNIALFLSFLLTILAPLTGLHVHKLASTVFLLLSVVHTLVYRKKLGLKRWLLLGLTVLSFLSGIFGMILQSCAVVMAAHKVLSIGLVFFLAIHIFVFHKKMR